MTLSRIFVAPKIGQGGVKNLFFSRNMGEKNLGTSGTIIAKNRFGRSGRVRPTVTSNSSSIDKRTFPQEIYINN